MAIKDADECAALCPDWDKPLARRAMALASSRRLEPPGGPLRSLLRTLPP